MNISSPTPGSPILNTETQEQTINITSYTRFNTTTQFIVDVEWISAPNETFTESLKSSVAVLQLNPGMCGHVQIRKYSFLL